ncbi:unnamed protein product [Linum trigynum]|uniref:Uncharacterized protein n=1 Tax=Linum trigynum TaxID=586398 RepID=A0AAV2GN31_9ROSI
MNLGPSMHRRAKGKEKQGSGRIPLDPKTARKPGLLGKEVGRHEADDRKPDGPVSRGKVSSNPSIPVVGLTHAVLVETRRRRLLLEEESEDELSPLFASLRGEGRSVEQEPVDVKRESKASRILRMECKLPGQPSPKCLAKNAPRRMPREAAVSNRES